MYGKITNSLFKQHSLFAIFYVMLPSKQSWLAITNDWFIFDYLAMTNSSEYVVPNYNYDVMEGGKSN